MFKTNYRVLTTSLAGVLLCGISFARQSSAPTANPPASSTSTKPKTQAAPTTKPGTTAAKKAPAPVVLKTQKDKASYAIGMNIGKGLKDNLKKNEIDIDPELLTRGLKDTLTEKKSLLTDEEAQAALTALANDVQKHQKELHDAAAAKNLKEGEAFLEANKAKPGVIVLPSGLQYKVLQEAKGPKPTADDTVVCNYRGTLVDGTEFDSSYKRNQPATFPVKGVIKGWTEALQLMPVGSKWELVIPANLAYGEPGVPRGPIGPNATLVFEVELLSIQPKPEAKPAAAAPAPGAAPQPAPQTPTGAKPQTPTEVKPATATQAPAQPAPQAAPQAKPQ